MWKNSKNPVCSLLNVVLYSSSRNLSTTSQSLQSIDVKSWSTVLINVWFRFSQKTATFPIYGVLPGQIFFWILNNHRTYKTSFRNNLHKNQEICQVCFFWTFLGQFEWFSDVQHAKVSSRSLLEKRFSQFWSFSAFSPKTFSNFQGVNKFYMQKDEQKKLLQLFVLFGVNLKSSRIHTLHLPLQKNVLHSLRFCLWTFWTLKSIKTFGNSIQSHKSPLDNAFFWTFSYFIPRSVYQTFVKNLIKILVQNFWNFCQFQSQFDAFVIGRLHLFFQKRTVDYEFFPCWTFLTF